VSEGECALTFSLFLGIFYIILLCLLSSLETEDSATADALNVYLTPLLKGKSTSWRGLFAYNTDEEPNSGFCPMQILRSHQSNWCHAYYADKICQNYMYTLV